MNISELIVEQLRQGKSVELPGMGTLKSVLREPYHDAATGTYYPASHTVALVDEQNGDLSLVSVLASRECVSEGVARQMWRNYTDALEDKLRSAGSHTFTGFGTIALNDGKYSFEAADGLKLDTGNERNMPLTDVKLYDHEGEEDPFARFDEVPTVDAAEAARQQLAAEMEAERQRMVAEMEAERQRLAAEREYLEAERQRLAAERQRQEAAAAIAEAERQRQEAAAVAAAEAERKRQEAEAAAAADAERQRQEAEAAAAAEAERKRQEAEAAAAAEAERQRQEAEAAAAAEAERKRQEAEAAAAAEAERKRQEAEAAAAAEAERKRREAEDPAEVERRRREAEASARAAEVERRREAEAAAAAEAERLRKEREAAAQTESKKGQKNKKGKTQVSSGAKKETKKQDNKNDEKKNRRWLWLLLLLLLLLLLGAGAYCYFSGLLGGRDKADKAAMTDEHIRVDAPATNDLTFNTDLIEYSDREIMRTSDLVCYNLADYLNAFLANRGYTGARAPMMERVRQYSSQRLGELLGDRMAVQRFIPYNDYIYNYNEPYLKYVCANRSRIKVQSELMDYSMLDNMLDRMVSELGLQPDGGVPKSAAEVQEVKAAERREIETRKQAAVQPQPQQQQQSAPVNVNMARDSKQGFDIIAGCYLNRATATNLTARLHELGCDAYIIEKNELFYVSMGSASNRTSAEALFKHIKSWYDGDVVIKEW